MRGLMSRLHSRLACVVVLVVAVAALHHAVLFLGNVYHMDDAADGYYPSHVAIARAFRHGELPTWERGAWSGWPLNVDPYYGTFYPLSAIFWLGPSGGLGWTIALHMVGAALGMLWLLRRRGLDWGPALLGAASYGLSSFMVERIRHIIFAEGMAWLPFILVGIEGWLQRRDRRELALAALAAGMAVLCGALPLVPYFAVIVVAYAVPRWLQTAQRRETSVGLGGMAAVAALLACAQAVPTMAHVPLSPRHLATDYRFAASYAWPELKYLGLLVAPDFLGGEEKGVWTGAYNYWEMAGYYVGVLALALMLVGLWRRKGELSALFSVALVAVLLAFGDKTPLLRFCFDHVPLFGTLRCPTRALVMLVFAAPLLGAEGLELMVARFRVGRVREIVFGVLAVVSLGGIFLLHHDKLTATEQAAQRNLIQLHIVVALAFALLALWQRLGPRVAAMLLALVALGDVAAVDAWHLTPRPGDWAPGTDDFAAVEWLRAQHPADRFAPVREGPFRLHNAGMTYALESAGGYDSVSVWRYVDFLQVLNTGAPYPYPSLRDDLAMGVIKRFGSPLVDLLNVRWAIAPSPPAAGWVERFRPAANDKTHARYEPFHNAALRVFENPHPLPRAFIVYQAEVIADEAQSARRLATLDPRKTAILDRAPQPPPSGDGHAFVPAQVTVAERHRLRIEAETPVAGILVVSETWYPGWTATLDGKPAELLRADHALRGLALPPGKHVVEMRFTSRPTQLGLALSLLGCVGLGLLFRRRVLK
jgi:hypothetical protein